MRPAEPDLFGWWSALVGDSERSREVWSDVVACWAEPQRSYHNLAHLVAVLGITQKYADQCDDPLCVQLAAWFHDAVYDPRSSTNETDSAAYAVGALDSLGFTAGITREVDRLVLSTATHEVDESDRNGALLSDADLTVLGSPPAAYLGYVNAVRQEYAHVSDDDFRVGRTAVLEGLLALDPIYRVPAVRTEIEPTARRNLTAELSLYQ